ncbi:MAG: hypothetical protein QG602_1328 [Verrucomicrobiota bacterium]|nr:hypothetical protein [Verrucomicrobiota bacterium]
MTLRSMAPFFAQRPQQASSGQDLGGILKMEAGPSVLRDMGHALTKRGADSPASIQVESGFGALQQVHFCPLSLCGSELARDGFVSRASTLPQIHPSRSTCQFQAPRRLKLRGVGPNGKNRPREPHSICPMSRLVASIRAWVRSETPGLKTRLTTRRPAPSRSGRRCGNGRFRSGRGRCRAGVPFPSRATAGRRDGDASHP